MVILVRIKEPENEFEKLIDIDEEDRSDMKDLINE